MLLGLILICLTTGCGENKQDDTNYTDSALITQSDSLAEETKEIQGNTEEAIITDGEIENL